MSSSQLTSARLTQQHPDGLADCNGSIATPTRESSHDRADWVLLGESVGARQLRSQIHRIAPYFRTALIRGEAGTGKELVARAIHAISPAADGPFIVADARLLTESVDCDGAPNRKAMLNAARVLDSAQGGTLYLTPVGDLSPRHQAALMRFFQYYEERRRAGPHEGRARTEEHGARQTGDGHTSTRILAASERDLRTLAATGQFRQELYTRLSPVEILVPPLRQRVADIPTLAEWLLHRLAEQNGQSLQRIAGSAMAQLQERPWLFNLRELERVVEQAAALAEGGAIEARHLAPFIEPGLADAADAPTLKIERLHDVIQRHVLDVLTRCGGNKVRAADRLGISRSTLYRMLTTDSVS